MIYSRSISLHDLLGIKIVRIMLINYKFIVSYVSVSYYSKYCFAISPEFLAVALVSFVAIQSTVFVVLGSNLKLKLGLSNQLCKSLSEK